MTGTVWDAFVARAEAHPDAPAIIQPDGVRGYADLRHAVEELAARITRAVPAGGLLALNATDPAIGARAMLAAARSGCALLPLDPDSPRRRRAAILADARPAAVLIQSGPGVLEFMDGAHLIHAPATAYHDMAYLLYTSGSTGQPKGVLVSHRALIDRLAGLAVIPGLRAGESMLAMTALCFDISMAELLLPLFVGGTVIAAPDGTRLDPSMFADVVRRDAPDVLQATPSFWRLAVAAGWSGARSSRIWCGGETMTSGLAADLLPRAGQLWNVYGPTEATIWASAMRVRSPGLISLGRALPGSGMCLSDGDGHIVSPGADGEITLYGNGLAHGYLNRPELTAQRFRTGVTDVGTRLCYFTGDRGRLRSDGTMEFLGRVDDQVKLRGHRIELGEIERTAESHPAVVEAVAVAKALDEPSRAHIAAFVVAEPEVTEPVVRAWLAEHLPPSMRPARIILIDAVPRTVAGKVDRVALGRDT